MHFVETPNIPNAPVKRVIIGEKYNFLEEALSKLGTECCFSSSNSSLDLPLSSHSDMSVLHFGGDSFALASGVDIIGLEENYQKIYNPTLSLGYPYDIFLNVALIDNLAVVGKKNPSKELKEILSKRGYKLIFVNQGYCKCSCAIVNQNAIITDDFSIYEALKSYIDVLLIKKGDIILQGYNYGFIGGACGLIGKNLMAFSGNIKNHTNFSEISSFLRSHNCDYVCLGEELIDIGGILPIIEE